MKTFTGDISIVLCGEAGQGIQTVESMVSELLKSSGCNIFASKEYMSRVRGGSNSTELRVTSAAPLCFTNRIDILIPFDNAALEHCANRITPNTLILADKKTITANNFEIFDIPLSAAAAETGGALFINVIATGIVLKLFNIEFSVLEENLKKRFAKKGDDIVSKNISAARKGYEMASAVPCEINIKKDDAVKDEMLLSGADAIGIGALSGGCDFIASYPMTPGSSVFTFLAQHAAQFGIAAEQAEDEISAINMGIGAAYAGAKPMVSTSGGGFALMVEGVSLAAMTETPIVVHLAQRPAPATGLPTRTEQADLNFALYSGHGEFPRAIFAAGDIADGVNLTKKAFEIADKYQIPAFILSDQYYVDSFCNHPVVETGEPLEKFIFKTDKNYMRYANTPNGVSPRGIPAYGDGFVYADSDEHDETGHITENENIRVLMNEKRNRKFIALQAEVLPAEFFGVDNYETLIICWGSTKNTVKEALNILGAKFAMLFFPQVYPLPKSAGEYLKKAKKIIAVENNFAGQFANLVKQQFGTEINSKVLKYNGLPFSADEIAEKLKSR